MLFFNYLSFGPFHPDFALFAKYYAHRNEKLNAVLNYQTLGGRSDSMLRL
jgi:hypothetical protein